MRVVDCGSLQFAVDALKHGKTIVFPTETSYGLGCDATNQKAVDKIYKIKGRERGKSLLVVVSSVEMAQKHLVWNELLEKIAIKYWPGAVTVVGESRKSLKSIKFIKSKVYKDERCLVKGVVAVDGTVAMRVTGNAIAKKLCEELGNPIVATSANISGMGEWYDAKEIYKIFSKRKYKPDIIVNAGVLPKRKPSTIVNVANNAFKIIRQGEVEINSL